jgi:hypothetical protein
MPGEASTCGACGEGATTPVILLVLGAAYQKDLCPSHLDKLLQGARIEASRSWQDPTHSLVRTVSPSRHGRGAVRRRRS